MNEDQKTAALSLLTGNSVGVLATLSPEGTPRARTLYYASDDAFGVYFCTLATTRKVEDIAHNRRGAFVVSANDLPQTIQIEGAISDLTETATINEVIGRLSDTLMKHGPHFAPLTHLDTGKIRFYKLTPSLVRFGDFTDGIGTEKTFSEIVF